MTRRRIYLFSCLVLMFSALQLAAQSSADGVVPGVVKFGGVLNDAAGKPLTGTIGVTFSLYQEQSGGTPLWMETQNIQADRNGHYSTLLGSTANHGIPADAFAAGEARWIGVQISGQAEQPRVQLVSVPYALKAADAQTLGGFPPSAFLLATPPATEGSTTTASQPQSTSATAVTTGGGTAQALAKFDGANDIANSQVFDTGTNVGVGTSTPAAKLDVKGASIFRGTLTLPTTGNATAASGKNSQPLSLTASAFNNTIGLALNQSFRWQAEPVANNSSSASGKLNLLFGAGSATPSETGLSISNTGILTFAPGQKFSGTGTGTVTSVALSAPSTDFTVSGSPVTGSGSLKLQWLVPPTTDNVANAIVKRDANGTINATSLNLTGALSASNVFSGPLQAENLASTGAAVSGFTGQGPGSGLGVSGSSNADTGSGVRGTAFGVSGIGVSGETAGNTALAEGVQGIAHHIGIGVLGGTDSPNAIGVAGVNDSGGDAVYGEATGGGFAGFFVGNVDVDGTLSKAAGSFKIDHPLDPANKYLYHSFVESPDMKNIYDGMVTTDAQGDAVVTMPDWFEALNRDFRYQLTVVGQFAQAIVASEMVNRSFTIKTDKPNVKVSWQVTGIRHDAFADAHRIPVEQVKPQKERGLYLHPELFGAPKEKSVAEARHPGAAKIVSAHVLQKGQSQ